MRRVIAVLTVVLLVSFLAGCGGESADAKQARIVAYQDWRAGVEKQLELENNVMKAVQSSIELYAAGIHSRYEAYGNAKWARDMFSGLWQGNFDPKQPSPATAAHAKALTEAVKAFRDANSCRLVGLSALMDFFDAPSPSKLDRYKSEIKTADEGRATGLKILADVESELGLSR